MYAQRVFAAHTWNELHQLRWHATHQRTKLSVSFSKLAITDSVQIQQNSNLPTVCDTTSRVSITMPSACLDTHRRMETFNSGMCSSQSFVKSL